MALDAKSEFDSVRTAIEARQKAVLWEDGMRNDDLSMIFSGMVIEKPNRYNEQGS